MTLINGVISQERKQTTRFFLIYHRKSGFYHRFSYIYHPKKKIYRSFWGIYRPLDTIQKIAMPHNANRFFRELRVLSENRNKTPCPP